MNIYKIRAWWKEFDLEKAFGWLLCLLGFTCTLALLIGLIALIGSVVTSKPEPTNIPYCERDSAKDDQRCIGYFVRCVVDAGQLVHNQD